MNYYYLAGFILFCIVFFIWTAGLDKKKVKNKRTEKEKNANGAAAEVRRDRMRSLHSRGKSSHDDDLLDPTNPMSLLSPLNPLYIGDYDSNSSSSSNCSDSSSHSSASSSSYNSGSSYSGGSSYSSSDSGSSSSCSGGGD